MQWCHPSSNQKLAMDYLLGTTKHFYTVHSLEWHFIIHTPYMLHTVWALRVPPVTVPLYMFYAPHGIVLVVYSCSGIEVQRCSDTVV